MFLTEQGNAFVNAGNPNSTSVFHVTCMHPDNSASHGANLHERYVESAFVFHDASIMRAQASCNPASSEFAPPPSPRIRIGRRWGGQPGLSPCVTYCKQYHSFFPKQRPIHSENPHPKCHLPCTSQTMRHHNCVSVHPSHAALVVGLHAVTACPTHCTIRCDSSPMPVLNEKCVAVMGGWAAGRI